MIYGEFDNELVKINGDLEVTGSIETDGDLGASGELNITGDATFSETVTIENRVGTANKSAFFDTDGKLVEGDIVSGGKFVRWSYCYRCSIYRGCGRYWYR